MGGMMAFLYALGGFVILFFGFQYLMVFKMKLKKGKDAPELSGKYAKAVRSGKKSLFYFYSQNCGACKAMTPIIENYSRKNPQYFKVDVQNDMETARKFGVMGTPSTVIIEGGKIREFLVGPVSEEKLSTLL